MAVAGTASPALIGVRRVVIACEPSVDLSDAERRDMCDQLVRKASQLTNLPVTAATAADLDPMGSRHSREQLILRVETTARTVDAGRKAVTFKVTPQRPARAIGSLAPVTSSASLVRVQGDWILQGPITAFGKLLGTSGSRKLHTPITSDQP